MRVILASLAVLGLAACGAEPDNTGFMDEAEYEEMKAKGLDHDHDGDGVSDHAAEDHDEDHDHDHDGDGEQDHAAEDHNNDHEDEAS
ncbi:MAG: hypothetical protein AAF249_02020 [Pseudomonadota bacterium]